MMQELRSYTVIKLQLANNGEKMKVKFSIRLNTVITSRVSNISAQRGFTLIEFMVAAILGLIVLLAIGGAYVSTQKVNEVATSRVTRQQELRMANNLLIRDARMAGSFGCANLSALTGGAGISIDQGAPKLSISDASYFNINNDADDDRVYSARILTGTAAQSMKDTIVSSDFDLKSDLVIFNYGINTQPLLTVNNVTGSNALSSFTLSDIGPFSGGSSNARVVLASCNRLDILQQSQLSLRGADVGISGLTIPINKTGANAVALPSLIAHFSVQATLSNLQTVVYAVGNIENDTGSSSLYRFELLNDGSWSAPQLLSRNIESMVARFIYVTGCADAASDVGTEKFKLDTSAFILEDTVAVPPTGLELTLTPSHTSMNLNVNASNVSTNASDLQPIVLNATMRGANVCANR